MVAISSWGCLNQYEHDVKLLTDRYLAPTILLQSSKPGLAYGMGRSYGDVCLNPKGVLWKTTGLDHFIHFDPQSGRLVCEAGVLLRDIQQLVIPQGWILPVTPGTQFVTVGGAIANDVHGKNHSLYGTFGNHVLKITLLRTSGEIIECGPHCQQNWFAATVGGLGLTGVILTAEIQLRSITSPWLVTETVPYTNIDEFFELAEDAESDWEHTVSWIDCVSGKRGLFIKGNYSNIHNVSPKYRTKPQLILPLMPPISLVNKATLATFNSIYFSLKKRQATPRLSHYEPFFYPLDNLQKWNRLYGPKGLYQYQCVIPRPNRQIIQSMLRAIARSKEGSFLAVLKTFGNQKSLGMLSFPQPGVTLALDFPNKGTKTLQLFDELDSIVREGGGRIYAAKDARMPPDLFETGYPQLNEFLQYRDPGISSALSRRLLGQ